jgi:midasin
MAGECWLSFAQFLLHLFVPGAPIDPAALQRCSNDYWEEQRQTTKLQLEMHRAFAKRADGNVQNGTIRYLENTLSTMPRQTERDSISALPDSRSDVTRLHMYWSEVHQFLSQVLSPQKLEAYRVAVALGDPVAPSREQVLQKSLSTFCQRLSAVYTDFEDVNGPLQLAFLSMRLGLRILTYAKFHPSVAEEGIQLSRALLAYPSVHSADLLCSYNAVPEASGTPFAIILARLGAISFEVQLSGEVENHLQGIHQAYEQALGLWLIDQARIEESEREAQSLYRRKDDGNLNEAEEEEQDFLSLFPEFEDILDAGEMKSQQTSAKHKPIIDSKSASQLFTIHQELFLDGIVDATTADARLMAYRRSLIDTLAETELSSWSDTLDTFSTPFQAQWLHDRLAAMGNLCFSSDRPYDFYFDENIVEARRAVDVLRALLQRVDTIIREWPDQMVLQHLKNRCEVIMGFGLHSSLAKLLSAIEHLLANIDDWEMYANRENSLKANQQELVALVVSWRRLELSSWQGLLDSQAITFETGASEWWFRLYEASIRGILKTTESIKEDEDADRAVADFLDSLVPLLDDFMTSSPLGQFASRLRLIKSMHVFAEKLANSLHGRPSFAIRRLHRVLCNTAEYFAQFEVKVTKSLVEQRKALEKSIRDFIKLASWKDVNIHALKQSAQKTHRQLYKIIRKFRELLRQPVVPLLEHSSFGIDQSPSVPPEPVPEASLLAVQDPNFPAAVSAVGQSAHLLNLRITFRNFEGLIRSRLIPHIQSHQANSVEGFADDIIAVSKSLANVSIPADLDAARRTKLAKNLLNRKRKAWSDLLKELKRAGFSANVKLDILEQNHSKRHLREQPTFAIYARKYPAAVKSEDYLHRVEGLLPQLREALSDHHPDLSTRELRRALMHIEHNFFASLQSRSS